MSVADRLSQLIFNQTKILFPQVLLRPINTSVSSTRQKTINGVCTNFGPLSVINLKHTINGQINQIITYYTNTIFITVSIQEYCIASCIAGFAYSHTTFSFFDSFRSRWVARLMLALISSHNRLIWAGRRAQASANNQINKAKQCQGN